MSHVTATPVLSLKMPIDGTGGRFLFPWSGSWSKRGPCYPDERQPIGIVCITPLLSPFLPDSFDRYDFFKRELLKTPYFEDNMACHVAASFGAVCDFSGRLRAQCRLMAVPGDRSHNSVLPG